MYVNMYVDKETPYLGATGTGFENVFDVCRIADLIENAFEGLSQLHNFRRERAYLNTLFSV